MLSPALLLFAAVDPTFLRHSLNDAAAVDSALTTSTCRYHAVFGGKAPARGVARMAKLVIEPGGRCLETAFEGEEQNWFVLSGGGTLEHDGTKTPLKTDDFLYLPSGKRFTLAAGAKLEVLIMGFKVPKGKVGAPDVRIANAAEVKKQVVGNHPPSTLYQLLIGDTKSTRDRIAAGAVVTSLFIMEITPGGTNTPHHHDREEEMYVLLAGEGEMVAGSGMDGVEGKFPAKAGDAYFYRLNTTVGFYNTGSTKARILAVRSLYPFNR
ncbi:MAG: cupin domain-containing protein [Bryobacteraceae bacterium]|nr:cupin domain-containing protein [Bryobacteraceae bacterium]